MLWTKAFAPSKVEASYLLVKGAAAILRSGVISLCHFPSLVSGMRLEGAHFIAVTVHFPSFNKPAEHSSKWL